MVKPVFLGVTGTHSTGKSTFCEALKVSLECKGICVATIPSFGKLAVQQGIPLLTQHTYDSTMWFIDRTLEAQTAAVQTYDIPAGPLSSALNRFAQQALPFSIVPTLFDRRTQASLGTLRVLRDAYPDTIWNGYIPVDTRLRDASRAGLAPSQFDPKSRGVLAYRALLKHLLSQQLVAQVA